MSQYAADPDNAPLWYENIKSVEWKTPRPVQIGSQVDFVAHFMGRRLAYTYEVIEFIPGRRLTMRTPGAPFPIENDLHLGRRGWGRADDASQPRHAERIVHMARASHVAHGRKGKQEGSRVAQATARVEATLTGGCIDQDGAKPLSRSSRVQLSGPGAQACESRRSPRRPTNAFFRPATT